MHTYRSENHVKGHGNVEVEGVIVNDADGEEHGHHNNIISGVRKRKP